MILRCLYDDFEMILASFGHHLGIIWASFRDHLGIIRASFGINLIIFELIVNVIFTNLWFH